MPRRTHLALIAGLLVTAVSGGEDGRGTFDVHVWHSRDPLFGGLSAIEMSADGGHALLLSDRGMWTRAAIRRHPDGHVAGTTAQPMRMLRGSENQPLDLANRDSEGLAVGSDGTIYVSFEGNARVIASRTLDGPSRRLPLHPDFRRLRANGALEALAVDAAGALYTLPEVPRRSGGPFQIYRFRDGVWDRFATVPRHGEFLPVGADVGPDGRFYLLERRFRGVLGFASRVRSFRLTAESLSDERTEFETASGRFDNLEGISVWRDATDRIVLSMISDDNFLFLQRTELVEVRLSR